MKDAFDLWWEWATKPHESMLSIDGDIHYPIMELSPEDRRDREKVDEAVRRYRKTGNTAPEPFAAEPRTAYGDDRTTPKSEQSHM